MNFFVVIRLLTQKGVTLFVLDNEYLRCSDGINFEEYTEEDIEKDLKKFEEEMGIDLLG